MSVELSFDKLVFGGSLESLLYSFVTETPIVMSGPIVPFELETLDYDGDFKFLGYENVRDIYKSEMWDRLSFILSMAGLIMMPNIIRTVRQDNKKIIFTTEGNSRTTINYNTLISFDKENESESHVYDWFDVKSLSKLQTDKISYKDNFVKDMYFYRSKRLGTPTTKKDLVVYSKVKSSEIYDYDKSESYCRLKAIEMMKQAGMRGKPNGYNSRGTALYYAIKIEHTHREIIKDYIPKFTFKQIMKKRKKEGDVWNLAKKLFRHRQITILRESSRLPASV